jgi:hypothetical protein
LKPQLEDTIPSRKSATAVGMELKLHLRSNHSFLKLRMRAAHPEEFVPQWPPYKNSVNHARRKGQCGTNS